MYLLAVKVRTHYIYFVSKFERTKKHHILYNICEYIIICGNIIIIEGVDYSSIKYKRIKQYLNFKNLDNVLGMSSYYVEF